MRPLHIVHTEASCGWGGQELRVLTEAKGLAKKGHHVSLLCPSTSHVSREALKSNINVIHFPLTKKRIKTVIALRKWLLQNKVDVINTHGSKDSWLMAVAAYTIPNGPPVVRTRHISTAVNKTFYNRWLYTKATQYVVTTGEQIKKHMINSNGFHPDRITSVPTGINANIFIPGVDRRAIRKQLNLPLDKTIIGIVAKLRQAKGHEFLLSAFAELKDRNCHLLIVGGYGGDTKSCITTDILNQIKALKLEDRVTMTGFQSNVVPYLQAMDIFALPTLCDEGVPQSITQAMMCELPVITTPKGCIKEAIIHQETGLLIPPMDIASLKRALKELISNETLRHQLGKAARVRAIENFCFDKMVNAMEDIFHQVVLTKHSYSCNPT